MPVCRSRPRAPAGVREPAEHALGLELEQELDAVALAGALVGVAAERHRIAARLADRELQAEPRRQVRLAVAHEGCLLYTSDAADE